MPTPHDAPYKIEQRKAARAGRLRPMAQDLTRMILRSEDKRVYEKLGTGQIIRRRDLEAK